MKWSKRESHHKCPFHVSFSLSVSHTCNWYNYSSCPHVPLATDDEEEEDGCLSAALPRSEDMARAAALSCAPRWDAARRGASAAWPTATVLRHAVWSTREVSQIISWGFYLSFIRNMHTVLPGLAHFFCFEWLCPWSEWFVFKTAALVQGPGLGQLEKDQQLPAPLLYRR